MNNYLEAIERNPESPAVSARDMIMNILNFYNKDIIQLAFLIWSSKQYILPIYSEKISGGFPLEIYWTNRFSTVSYTHLTALLSRITAFSGMIKNSVWKRICR